MPRTSQLELFRQVKRAARTSNRLDRVSKLIDALEGNAATDDGLKFDPLDVPDNWVDFARLCRVKSGKGISYFDPYDYQVELVKAMTAHRGTVVLKSRQLGVSETAWIWFLWRACRHPGYIAALFSKRKDDTSALARRVRLAIGGLGITLDSDNLMTMILPNGSQLLFRTAKKTDARSIASVHDLLFDEAAFVDDIEEIYGGAIPTQSTLGDAARTLVVSTPDSPSGWFFEMLTANNGKRSVLDTCKKIRARELPPSYWWCDDDGWAKVFLHWRAHPLYGSQDDYLQKMAKVARLPMQTVKREYDLDFGQSDRAVFGVDLIEKALSHTMRSTFQEV